MKKTWLPNLIAATLVVPAAILPTTSCNKKHYTKIFIVTFMNDTSKGKISKAFLEVDEGRTWSKYKDKITVTANTGWEFTGFKDDKGQPISDDMVFTSNVTFIAQYRRASFSSDTWEGVCETAKGGLEALKANYTDVKAAGTCLGLTRTIKLAGVEHTVRVIGENHDNISLTSKALLTFEVSTVVCNDAGRPLGSPYDTTNNYDYLNSVLRANIDGGGTSTPTWHKTCLQMLKEGNETLAKYLKTVEKTVAIKNDQNNYVNKTYKTEAFALTYIELGGDKTLFDPTEGTQYELYANASASEKSTLRAKSDGLGNDVNYWSTSPHKITGSSLYSHYVKSDGTLPSGVDIPQDIRITALQAISFAFCI